MEARKNGFEQLLAIAKRAASCQKPDPSIKIRSMDDILKTMTSEFTSSLILTPTTEIEIQKPETTETWKYVCVLIETFMDFIEELDIKESLRSEEEKKIELLSIGEQRNLIGCLEQIIGFGLRPYIAPALFPYKSDLPESVAITDEMLKVDLDQDAFTKFGRIKYTIEALFKILSDPNFLFLRTPQYVSVALAGFFFYVNVPLAEPVQVKEKKKFTVDQKEFVLSERKDLLSQYEDFYNKVPKHILTISLFLTGRSGQPSKFKWFTGSIFDNVHRIMIGENGILLVSRSILSAMENSEPWKVWTVIVNIILHSIANKEKEKEFMNNFKKISSQIIRMITNARDQLNSNTLTLMLIGIQLGITLYKWKRVETEENIWKKLFKFDKAEHRDIFFIVGLAKALLENHAGQEYSHYVDFINIFHQLLSILTQIEIEIENKNLMKTETVLKIIEAIEVHLVNLYEVILSKEKENLADFSRRILLGKEKVQRFEIKSDGEGFRIYLNPIDANEDSSDSFNLLNKMCEVLIKRILLSKTLVNSNYIIFTQLLDESDSETENESRKEQKRFVNVKLLEIGSDDQFTERCLKSIQDDENPMAILIAILRKIINDMKNVNDELNFPESLNTILGIVIAIAQTLDKSNEDVWTSLNSILPILTILNINPIVGSELKRLSNELKEIILTRGISNEPVKKSLFKKAKAESESFVIPTKGHGLLELRKLVEAGDPETLSNADDLMELFEVELIHEDSYIYLMAIQGLSALAIIFHEKAIPKLLNEYMNVKGGDKGERRLKIGEVLVKTMKKLGKTSANYRVLCTNAFLALANDEDSLVRASALSNLAELAGILGFSIGSILTEVWVVVKRILEFDKAVEVRRAGLHLITLLLRYIVNEIPIDQVIADRTLSIYLKEAQKEVAKFKNDPDPMILAHVDLALVEFLKIVQMVHGHYLGI